MLGAEACFGHRLLRQFVCFFISPTSSVRLYLFYRDNETRVCVEKLIDDVEQGPDLLLEDVQSAGTSPG